MADSGMTYWQAFKLFETNPVKTIFSDTAFVLGIDDSTSGIAEVMEVDAYGTVAIVSGMGIDPIQSGFNAATGRLTEEQKAQIQQQAYDSVLQASNGDGVAAQKASDEVANFIQQREGGTAEDAVISAASSAGSYIAIIIGVVAVIIGFKIYSEV